MTPLLLKKAEVAALLGVSPSTVDRLERAGRIPRRVQLGAGARWLESELREAVLKLTRGPSTARTAAASAARRGKPE